MLWTTASAPSRWCWYSSGLSTLALAHCTLEAHLGASGEDDTLDQVGSPERLQDGDVSCQSSGGGRLTAAARHAGEGESEGHGEESEEEEEDGERGHKPDGGHGPAALHGGLADA